MSGSGTGTPAVSPSTVTAQDLIDDNIRPALDDALAAEFTDAELLSFLNEAIREYTQHFPRIGETALTAVAQQRTYTLPLNTRNIIAVEYPTGEDPQTWLNKMDRQRPSFARFEYYDFLPTNDLTTAPVILLSFDPVAAETITVTRQYEHDYELTVSDYITVPSDHHHILTQYVLFAAARQEQAREEANPTSSSSLLMSQYASNTRRYELAYLNAINRILYHRRGKSTTVSWAMDTHDRIY